MPKTQPEAKQWWQTELKHTPGPWKVSSIDHAKHRAYVWTDRQWPQGFCVAEVRPETILRDELEANAALIAAAPDLLKFAIAYRNRLRTSAHTEGEVATYAHLVATIAKAEGR